MKILIVGSAGHVGAIVRPALEAQHTCYHYDLRPVPGVIPAADGGRGYVASIDDSYLLRHAMIGMDVVINLAMGVRPGTVKDVSDINPVFDVNVRGCYRILLAAQSAGVRRIVNASSLSVFRELSYRDSPLAEDTPTDAWFPYGISKRIGEFLCDAAAQARRTTGIVSLRLMHPADEATYAARPPMPFIDSAGRESHWCSLGPKDTRRLFLAAIDYTVNPGHHVFHATGEVNPKWFPANEAAEKLGWRALGE